MKKLLKWHRFWPKVKKECQRKCAFDLVNDTICMRLGSWEAKAMYPQYYALLEDHCSPGLRHYGHRDPSSTQSNVPRQEEEEVITIKGSGWRGQPVEEKEERSITRGQITNHTPKQAPKSNPSPERTAKENQAPKTGKNGHRGSHKQSKSARKRSPKSRPPLLTRGRKNKASKPKNGERKTGTARATPTLQLRLLQPQPQTEAEKGEQRTGRTMAI